MDVGLVESGVNLMLYGMGTVFVFLTVLVFSTQLMSFLVNRFFPETAPAEAPAKPIQPVSSASVDAKTLKVVQEAIYQHRARVK